MITPTTTWTANSVARSLKGGGTFEGPTAMGAAFKWASDDAVPEGIRTAFHLAAEQAESYMKANAKWQDRSGDAREGLNAAVAEPSPNQFGLVLSHATDLDYPVYLENRWNGRFAIVVPTTQVFGSKLDRIVSGQIVAALSGRGSKFRHRKTGQFVS